MKFSLKHLLIAVAGIAFFCAAGFEGTAFWLLVGGFIWVCYRV